MSDGIFIQIFNMSFTASFVIIFVLIIRLLLKKTPKIFSYVLWSVVLFRLVCPFSFEGAWSLLPVNSNPIATDIAYAQTPRINTGITAIDSAINPMLPAATPYASVNPLQIWAFWGKNVWIVGIAALLLYSAGSLARLRRKLVGAVKLRENIYLADHIMSPFVIGVIRPKIYLPSTLSEQEQSYIILHEQTHIRRFDHIVKIVAFFTLVVHWFNPLVWVAFILCNRDMEMSCDESVMKQMGADIRREYSSSLLCLATGKRIITGAPLAFGEGDTKGRIKNVMNYKKPVMLIVLVAAVIVIVAFSGLMVNPARITHGDLENENIIPLSFSQTNISVLPLGEYILAAPSGINSPRIILEKGNKFDFSYSFFSSYWPRGTYRIKDGYLILTTDDRQYTYIFLIDKGTLIFQADQSSSITVYGDERPVVDGDVFIYVG